MTDHPITGQKVNNISINTRTFVVWALGVDFDIDMLWKHVSVSKKRTCGSSTARVCFISYNGAKRGHLRKRNCAKPFKSVLSLDVQFQSKMPNVKVSRKNTIQVTGCCSLSMLMEMLHSLVIQYTGQGISLSDTKPGFVADIVLSNVYFRLPSAVNRKLISELVEQSGRYVVSYEPVTRDASVSIRNYNKVLPNNGKIYSLWHIDHPGVEMISRQQLVGLRPGLSNKIQLDIHTFRVFQSGSVVHIGRWPASMETEKDSISNLIVSTLGDCLRQTQIDKYFVKNEG
jgi:hypothetical protein